MRTSVLLDKDRALSRRLLLQVVCRARSLCSHTRAGAHTPRVSPNCGNDLDQSAAKSDLCVNPQTSCSLSYCSLRSGLRCGDMRF